MKFAFLVIAIFINFFNHSLIKSEEKLFFAKNKIENIAKNESISLHPDQIESIVVPNGALGGEAVLAGIEKGLNIISVKNQNVLKVTNEFYSYPNLFEVDNYLEAAGIILAIKKGINLDSVKRPLKKIQQSSYSD